MLYASIGLCIAADRKFKTIYSTPLHQNSEVVLRVEGRGAIEQPERARAHLRKVEMEANE